MDYLNFLALLKLFKGGKELKKDVIIGAHGFKGNHEGPIRNLYWF
jgi:hypothetical protein